MDIITIWSWYGLDYNDIDFQITLIFEQTLVKYKHVVELCKIWNFINLTLTLTQ